MNINSLILSDSSAVTFKHAKYTLQNLKLEKEVF